MEFVKIVHAVFSKRISKVLFCLLCFLGIGMGAYSQDVIVKKDGEEIKSWYSRSDRNGWTAFYFSA